MKINSLEITLGFIVLGWITNNYDLLNTGMSMYQVFYANKLYPK
ncbi:MAG: hypothetical protein ACTSPI_01405 [Candidatus Heimdallarchaeaceae archaeon]